MRREIRSGGRSLKRSSLTQRYSTNGRRRKWRKISHIWCHI